MNTEGTTAAVAALPAAAASRFKSAESLLRAGDDAGARKIYLDLVRTAPAGLLHFRLGEICNRAGEIERAEVHHTRAFELTPNWRRGSCRAITRGEATGTAR